MLLWAKGLKLDQEDESLTTTKAAQGIADLGVVGGRSGWAARGVS